MVYAVPRVGPDKLLDIAGPDACASVLPPDRGEPIAAPHPHASRLGRLPEPPRRRQDRDRPLRLPLAVVSEALRFAVGGDFPGAALGLLLGAEPGHRR